MRKTIALTFILIGILVFSVFNTLATKAITLEEIQAQIQQLLQAINSLKVQIQTMNQTSTSVQPQSSTSSCPFVSLMYRGYSESATSETTELQKFLKQYPSIYPEGLVTGYFGRLTEAAVQRFQSQYGISATGQVGPQTRAKLCSFWQGGISIGSCGWCGNTCVRKTTGMYCADVMPPVGSICQEVNGVCQVSSASASQVKVISPNGGETFIQRQNNIIRWSGGLGIVQVGLVNSSNDVEGWIILNGTPNNMVYWDGTVVGDLSMTVKTNVQPGLYKILVVSASPIGNYCFGNNQEICNYDYSDSWFTLTGSTSSNLPDLTVTDLTCSPNNNIQLGQSTHCTITVNNKGSADAQTHKLEASVGGKSAYSVYGIVSAGQTEQTTFSWQCTEAGDFTVKAVVDSENIIQESNENNNEKTISICCGGTCTGLPTSNLPDLTISEISADKTTLSIGETTRISATEKNIGNASAGYHKTGIFEDNIESDLNYSETNVLAPGYGFVLSANYTCYRAGTHTIQAIADYIHQVSTGQVLESNESNNSKTITINCLASTSNLSVTCVSSKTSNTFNVGESLSFFALPLGGSGSYPTAVWSGDVSGTGLSRIVSFSSTGTKTATVKVTDSNGATATASCSVTILSQAVSLPDLTISSITYSPANPKVGDSVNFFVDEKNIGNATAGYHYIECFENNISLGKNFIPNELVTNATANYSFIRTYNTAGTLTIKCKTDADNRITELSETNNEKTISLSIGSASTSVYPTRTGCIKSPAYNEDTCSGYRLIKNLNYSGSCYSLSQCLAVQGDGTCVKSPVYQGDTCSGYRLMSGVSRNCYTYDQCLTANQASFLESLRIQLAQINELVKKLTASLIEMNR